MVGDTAGLGELSHLHESARALARLPDSDRLRHVRAERWIGYSRANEALARLQTLVQWPDRQRMPNLLLIGPTNNGKSMIIEKFCRTHPPVSHPGWKEIPVLTVQMPSEPSVARFYTTLLAAIGGPTVAWSLLAVERLVLQRLRDARVRMLVIDELHNVLAGRSDRRREFLNLIRFLGNQLRIPLVGVGTREAYLAIRSDDQLENRFEPFVLPRWQAGEEACSLLASFAASFPLRRESQIATRDMADYLLTRSEGTIGELAHLLTDAAVAAIESGEEAITQRTLLMAPYTARPSGAGCSSGNWHERGAAQHEACCPDESAGSPRAFRRGARATQPGHGLGTCGRLSAEDLDRDPTRLRCSPRRAAQAIE